jgi:hypothetical protein
LGGNEAAVEEEARLSADKKAPSKIETARPLPVCMERARRRGSRAVFPPGRRGHDPRVLPIIAMAIAMRDALGLLVLVGLFLVFVNQSEQTVPRWLRRRGWPPPLSLETEEGRRRLKRLMADRADERAPEERSDSDSLG